MPANCIDKIVHGPWDRWKVLLCERGGPVTLKDGRPKFKPLNRNCALRAGEGISHPPALVIAVTYGDDGGNRAVFKCYRNAGSNVIWGGIHLARDSRRTEPC